MSVQFRFSLSPIWLAGALDLGDLMDTSLDRWWLGPVVHAKTYQHPLIVALCGAVGFADLCVGSESCLLW